MKNRLLHCVRLLLVMLAFGNMIGCGPTDEVVDIPGDYELRRKPGDAYFAIYFSPNFGGRQKVAPEVRSEAIFDGTFEPLNIADLPGSEDMFILQASGKKYLMDGYSGKLMFDGNPYIQYAKDNDGGIYFQTDKGLYCMSSEVPAPVEQYYRTGGAFVYRLGGKWGVYQNLIKNGTNVFRAPEHHYVEIMPAQFDKIRFVYGDGARHYIAMKNGKWQLYDGWGRIRRMCIGSFDKHRMNIYSQSGSGERDVTQSYINKILSIPVDCKKTYIPYLDTQCTYIGTEEAGIIRLEFHKNKYQSFYSSQNDCSTQKLPWDEKDVDAEYHYFALWH